MSGPGETGRSRVWDVLCCERGQDMPAHPSLSAQEREAADIFARADRRGPPTNSVVRHISSPLSIVIHSRPHTGREEMPWSMRFVSPALHMHLSNA
jgi:hypothetical protein